MQPLQTSLSFSRLANVLRFPLILLVVAIHSFAPELRPITSQGGGIIPLYISELIPRALANVAVPLFFCLSGYYTLFRKDWSLGSVCLREGRKRLRTLALPYLLWNVLYILLLMGRTWLVERSGGVPSDPFYFTLGRLPDLLWTHVIDYPLWYLRELLVLNLVTPLLYLLLKRLPALILLGLGIWLMWPGGWAVPGITPIAFFFFALGGYFGQRELDPLATLRPLRWVLLPLATLTTLILPLLVGTPAYHWCYRLGIISLCYALPVWIRYLGTKYPALATWSEAQSRWVFFIYAVHVIFLVNWARGAVQRFPVLSSGGWGELLGFCLIELLTLLGCFVLYQLLHRLTPRALALLCGGRA